MLERFFDDKRITAGRVIETSHTHTTQRVELTPVGLARPLILGVGNLLMGDEGIGVEAIRYLERAGFADHADLVDGGTGGFHLLNLFQDYSRIILIDAAADGKPTGTVSLVQPRFASDFPPTLAAHDIGLKDLIEAAALIGSLPQVDLITISIGGLSAMTLELSEPVRCALPRVVELVAAALNGLAGTVPDAPVPCG